MCGIVGYVGAKQAADYVLDGLRRLEYRGYDSAGIATVHGGKIELRRKKGKLQGLTDLLKAEPMQGSIAIGHTRWATHGRPSDENAHPHHVDDIVLVHNGIIENFLELRRELQAQGRTFHSETDTEIIAHLVAQAPGEQLEDRVRHALKRLTGAYALAVLSSRDPNTIVVAKNASPLIIGVKPDGGMIASDIPALLPHTRQVIVLEEGEMALVRAGEVIVKTLDGVVKPRTPRTIEWSPVMAEKGGHKHFMHKEIHEQPRAVMDTLRGRLSASGDNVELEPALVEAMASAQRVVFTACGTSAHASYFGQLALEDLARVGCEVSLASELRYRNPLIDSKTVVVAVSQSGETADTLAAIKSCKALGAKVVAIVNAIDSSIARESDWAVYTNAGPEIGVASTKAFVTQVVVLMLLAIAVGRQRNALAGKRAQALISALRELPGHIESILSDEASVVKVANRFGKAHSCLFLGRSYGYPVALEGALKLKEISYIHAEGYAAGEMKHGPIALVEPAVPIVVVATKGPLYEKVVSNLQEVRARDGHVIAIASASDERIAELCADLLRVPDADPMLAALLACVPLQLLAYHVADNRGTDVDQPRNLAKSVTVE